jgi:hypothetical protein
MTDIKERLRLVAQSPRSDNQLAKDALAEIERLEKESDYEKGYLQALADIHAIASEPAFLFDTSRHTSNSPMNASIYYLRKRIADKAAAIAQQDKGKETV